MYTGRSARRVPARWARGGVFSYRFRRVNRGAQPIAPIADITEIDDADLGTLRNQFFFFGSWTLVDGSTDYLGTHRYSGITNDYYEVRFYGVQAVVYGTKGPDHGESGVALNGGAEVTVDNYQASTYSDNTYLYQTPVLPLGEHIIKVRVKGTKNPNSTSFTVSADRVQARLTPLPAPEPEVRDINDATLGTGQNQFEYSGGPWLEYLAPGNYLGGRRYTDVSGSFYQVRFTGTQYRLFLTIGPNHGIIAVSTDAGAETLVDIYQSGTYTENVRVYTSPTLTAGTHILKVRNTGTKNTNSTGFHSVADRVEVRQTPTSDTPSPPPPPPPGNLLPLYVDGKYIKDSNGQIRIFHGVDLIHLDQLWDGFRGLSGAAGIRQGIDRAIDRAAGWYCNMIRLPITTGSWAANQSHVLNDLLVTAVAHCKTKGIYCIIDWHDYTRTQGTGGTGTDGEYTQFKSRVDGFWAVIAPFFKNEPHVLYEMMNEPIQVDYSETGGTLYMKQQTWDRWRSQAQDSVTRIRNAAPNIIILIGCPKYSAWLQGVTVNPFSGTNLAYVWHWYGGQYYPDNAGSHQNNATGWQQYGGQAADVVPVFITEWGYGQGNSFGTSEPERASWATPARNWWNTKKAAGTYMHMFAWSFDADYTPSMFSGSGAQYVTRSDFGNFAEDWIADELNV